MHPLAQKIQECIAEIMPNLVWISVSFHGSFTSQVMRQTSAEAKSPISSGLFFKFGYYSDFLVNMKSMLEIRRCIRKNWQAHKSNTISKLYLQTSVGICMIWCIYTISAKCDYHCFS